MPPPPLPTSSDPVSKGNFIVLHAAVNSLTAENGAIVADKAVVWGIQGSAYYRCRKIKTENGIAWTKNYSPLECNKYCPKL